MKVPFCDDELMMGPPDCSLAAFKKPLLRQCPFDLATISWKAHLGGGGVDGYVWRVKFGDGGPFALKVVSRPSLVKESACTSSLDCVCLYSHSHAISFGTRSHLRLNSFHFTPCSVYEYIEEGENDEAAVKQTLEFLWLAGFSLDNSPMERNWKKGVLIDLADIVSPRGYGWEERIYRPMGVGNVPRGNVPLASVSDWAANR